MLEITLPDTLVIADRDALGTTARIVTWPRRNLAKMLSAVDAVLADLDLQASRFRDDSEISVMHAKGAGLHQVSDGLAEAIQVALAAAEWTGGRCDPTVGNAMIRLGYDRDFAAIETAGDAGLAPDSVPAAGWTSVLIHENTVALPDGVLLDLGATAKGLGADRAAAAAHEAASEGGVLVSLGGDLAVAGRPPAGGWPVLIADEHRQVRQPGSTDTQQVRLTRGGLATSSVTCRRWQRADKTMHHIVDPRTGFPADGPWRTISVAAATCAEANAATTAAIVAGAEAVGWLTSAGLPARLVGHDGAVAMTPGWPADDDGLVDTPPTSQLSAYLSAARSEGGRS